MDDLGWWMRLIKKDIGLRQNLEYSSQWLEFCAAFLAATTLVYSRESFEDPGRSIKRIRLTTSCLTRHPDATYTLSLERSTA